jgi:nucleotide-binding universal stress UspA family protein
MATNNIEKPIASNDRNGTLLVVADFLTGSPDILDFACRLAESQNADLQLLHVIDPEHAHSSPDAQMGAQFSIEMLAKRARALRRSAVSLLSFGPPESVIPRRASEVNASLVVLPLNGSAADHPQKRLARRLRGKCNCPVLAVPMFYWIAVLAPFHFMRCSCSFDRFAKEIGNR